MRAQRLRHKVGQFVVRCGMRIALGPREHYQSVTLKRYEAGEDDPETQARKRTLQRLDEALEPFWGLLPDQTITYEQFCRAYHAVNTPEEA